MTTRKNRENPPGRAAESPRQAVRAFIRNELLPRPDYPLADDEPLFSGGLIDSFSLARLGVFIESKFGVFIPDTQLTVEHMDTVDQIVRRIEAADRIHEPGEREV